MQQYLNVQRDLRNIEDPAQRSREFNIKQIQATYGYDRKNAEKVYEMMAVKRVETMWGAACGAFAAYKAGPIQRELEHSHSIFRKAWMRHPLRVAAFATAYYVGTQLPSRAFCRLSRNDPGVTNDVYTSKFDYVSRFRLFEDVEARPSNKEAMLDYLAAYSADPLSEPELREHLYKKIAGEFDLSELFQVKRLGKDADDIFYTFGKIHGLENIAFIPDDKLQQIGGDIVALQNAINEIDGRPSTPASHEQSVADMRRALATYQAAVDRLSLHSSDRKKLLALPFYLSKRVQLPEPKRGSREMALFEQIYGLRWHEDAGTIADDEHKITEFNYEQFFTPELLKNVDTEGEAFKGFVNMTNFSTQTKLERLQAAREEFKQLMPFLAGLSDFEMRSLVHLLQNRSPEEQLVQELASDSLAKKLAKVSDAENQALKNRYRHQRRTMDYAEAKRMPVDERKVKDLLRNQHLFRKKFNEEVGTFQKQLDNPQMENGVLTYLNEAAYGDMRALLKDIGMNRDSIRFYNLADIRKLSENQLHESDEGFKYLMNALFTPVDMTDHEDTFVGWDELPGALPITDTSRLMDLQPEKLPQTNKLSGFIELENRPIRGTSATFRGMLEDMAADVEEEEDTGYGAEGDDDDYGDYGEEGEEGEYGDYGDYGEEEEPEDPEFGAEVNVKLRKTDDRFFVHNTKLREEFNEVEIGAFMKLLSVKPHKQWQDTSTYHYKLGVHDYEDESQELDPAFHLLSEYEREEAERNLAQEFRMGSEVKLPTGRKAPVYTKTRF